MIMTKRDIADIALIWWLGSFVVRAVSWFPAVISAMSLASAGYGNVLVILVSYFCYAAVLVLVLYVLMFKRGIILNKILPDGEKSEIQLDSATSGFLDYTFWIRLIGISLFLSDGVHFVSQIASRLTSKAPLIVNVGMLASDVVAIALSAIVIWKADYLADLATGAITIFRNNTDIE